MSGRHNGTHSKINMTTLQLGFKAFDPHELLCHFIAHEAGLYKREKLNVELIDITFIPDTELPESVFQASCGAALASAIKGIPQRVIFVATDRPMFWIYSSSSLASLQDLSNTKIATFPVVAPPHHLANIILNKAGINVEQSIELLAARDDVARFGLLKSGSVDAAVISSAIAPAKIEQSGLNKLCFFGDEIRIPTTGLGIDQSFLDKEPQLAISFVNILKVGLSIIHNDPDFIALVLNKYFDVDDSFKNETAKLYQKYYTQDGRCSEEIAQKAIDALCVSFSISPAPAWNAIYLFPE
jgi:ABC-type nitrate/sulfonate/bicarbonate transport system substrate-binding protein